MDTTTDFHIPQWLGNEIVSSTLCTNTGLQNITRPAGVKNPRENFDYIEVGMGPRKIRLYSTADAIFIAASKVMSNLNVQPRAAAIYSRYLVSKAETHNWTHDSEPPSAWLVFDGLELTQGAYGPPELLAPFLLDESEVLTWVKRGALVLNAGELVQDVLVRLEEMRQYRLRDRGKSRNDISPEQAARQVRQLEKSQAPH